MKVLLWGIYSPWTMNLLENFLLKQGYEVWAPVRGNRKEDQKYLDFYREKGVHMISFPQAVSDVFEGREKGNFLKVWYSHFLKIREVVKEGPFDLINMQYAEYTDLFDVVALKYLTGAGLVLSYWGSDLFRLKEGRSAAMGRYARHADYITFDSRDLEAEFRKRYGRAGRKGMGTVMFGLPVLSLIEETRRRSTREELRRKWGIPEDAVVIAAGYNGIPEQQHKRVLGAIGKLSPEWKEKAVIVLQMTYGGTKGYRRSVAAAAEKTGCRHKEFERFQSPEEAAEFRLLSDIYINAQTTDAFSGSVCEYLSAGAVLLNARWLRYREFEKGKFRYVEFADFTDLTEQLERTLKEMPDVRGNREAVWRFRSWERCLPRWEKVYQKVRNR